MRVAIISPLFESVPPRLYGGTERVVYNLCQGLSQVGVDVTLFASGDSSVPVEIVPVVDEALRLRKQTVVDFHAYSVKMIAEVAHRAREFDIIHNNHDYFMLPLSRIAKVPFVTTLHGRLDIPDIGEAFRSYPQAFFTSISDAQRKPFPDLRWVQTVYHGLNLDNFRFSPEPGKYLAFLGRISFEKRPDWAIQIAKKSGVPLKIAAKIEGEKDAQYFESVIKPQIDGKFIEFIGEISESEKSDFLGNALALVFPIDWPEPFGLVTIESLACGTPVLARPCGSVPEILADGITGFVSSSINDLTKRVADIPSIDRLSCRTWVEQRFSFQRMTEDYLNVYRSLIAQFNRATAGTVQDIGTAHYRRHFLHTVKLRSIGNS